MNLLALTEMTEQEKKVDRMIRQIVEAICLGDNEIKIAFTGDEFHIQVSGEKHGRLVGKKGITIWAISALVAYAGRQSMSTEVAVRLMEPRQRAEKPQLIPFKPRGDWDAGRIERMVTSILRATLKEPPTWVLSFVSGQSDATASITLSRDLKQSMEEPSFEEALDRVIHAAGMTAGAIIRTVVKWK